MLRAAVIGTGFGARGHIPALRAAGVTVTALASTSAERARDVASRFGIPYWTSDIRTLVSHENIDLVCIASPPHMHRDHVLAALGAGKHVLCEKPFARDALEARAMVDAAHHAGVRHAVNHEFRYIPARMELKRRIESGALGQIALVDVSEVAPELLSARSPLADWWYRRELGGGLLRALGSHWIDTLRWWLGEVAEVRALTHESLEDRVTTRGVVRMTSDDSSVVAIRFVSGTLATIAMSWTSESVTRRAFIAGANGHAVLEGRGRLLLGMAGALAEISAEPPTELVATDARGIERYHLDALVALVADLRRDIEEERTDSSIYPTFDDGLRVQEILDAAVLSASRADESAPATSGTAMSQATRR